MAQDEEDMPELATNDEWRGIMARARKSHSLSQEQLGNDVGLSQVMISKLESGESSSSTFVLRICRRLSIPEPQHFANEAQREWSQLGHILRDKGDETWEAALQLLRTMAKRAENDAEPEPPRPDRRK